MNCSAALFILALPLLAESGPFASRMTTVRVYPGQAWITRVVEVPIEHPGIQRLRIGGLPSGLAATDIEVAATGLAGLRVSNLALDRKPNSSSELPEYKAALAEKARLERQVQELKLKGGVLQGTMNLLENLDPTHMAKEAVPHTFAELRTLVNNLTHGFREVLERKLVLDAQQRTLQDALAATERTLQRLFNEGEAASRVLALDLHATSAGKARIELRTRTTAARWKPSYEVRLSADRTQLELACYASVSQLSGEAWKGVRLELASAEPVRRLDLPKPRPGVNLVYQAPVKVSMESGTGSVTGEVRDLRGTPIPGVHVKLTGLHLSGERYVYSDANGGFRFPLLPPGEFEIRFEKSGYQSIRSKTFVGVGMSVIVKQRMGSEAAATVEVVASSSHLDLACVAAGVSSSNDALDAVPRPVLEAPSTLAEHVEGLSQTWAVEGVRDLPSDGEPRRLLIGRVELPAETYLLAVPAVSTAVELRTALRTLPNLPWYPGAPMAVFFGSERTGQSQLPRSIPSQPTSVSFGPVQGLRARRLRTEAVAEAFNPTRTKEWRAWRFADRIEIVNRTGEPAKVEVHEPAVLALAQQVEVEDRSLPLPDPGKNRQDRRVWTVEVPARDTATVLSVLRIRARASGTIRELQALGLPETD